MTMEAREGQFTSTFKKPHKLSKLKLSPSLRVNFLNHSKGIGLHIAKGYNELTS